MLLIESYISILILDVAQRIDTQMYKPKTTKKTKHPNHLILLRIIPLKLNPISCTGTRILLKLLDSIYV